MATIETLIEQIDDKTLRDAVAREVGELKKRLDWGLVFERHLPENVRTPLAPVRVGSVVWERRSTKPRRFRVRAIDGSDLLVAPEAEKTTAPADAPTERIARDQVLVEQDFAEPIFPVLTPIGSTLNGPAERPRHIVVEGENYHAIQALLVAYEGQVDVMYLDPPYNTGSRDWSYNNDYVDPNDTYRPSKWLAFMERRLRIARRLMKPDGVMVVTIDENEAHHLGMLLEQVFPEARQQMVSIVINPIGQERGGGLARVDEQAFFVFFGNAAAPVGHGDDLLNERPDTKRARNVRWEWLIRGGPISRRVDRPGLFYPVLVDTAAGRVVKAGPSLLEGDPDLDAMSDGLAMAWPIRTDGSHGYWRIGQTKLERLIDLGYVRLGGFDPKRKTWTVLYVADSTAKLIDSGTIKIASRDTNNVVSLEYAEQRTFSVKTVWNRARHTAGIHGSHLLTTFIGERGSFTFPKSIYAVRDTLDILVHDKPDAVVMDFFAGSGTTLHATLLLNAEGGQRRCILVTNNELNYDTSARLHRSGLFRGDPEFEAAGVFESSTRPRVVAAVTGKRGDGATIEGAYEDGREYAEGFPENVEFFRLDYLEAAEVEFGLRFAEIHPLLWLRAGGIGEREELDPTKPLGLPRHSPYAVLFDPSGLPDLLTALETRTDIAHVFVVADSDDAFNLARTDLPRRIEPVRLYRDYLETMRHATR